MKSLEELKQMRDEMKVKVEMRESKEVKCRVLVGMATCGIASGARPILNKFVQEVANQKIEGVMVTQVGCVGQCEYEPIVELVETNGRKTTYVRVKEDMVNEIIESHITNGKVVEKYTLGANK